ncbi:MAG: hypothetical protein ACQCN5_00085 [Candidatus Bathyarchaeia archaeon]|jgi:hypothetical protein
MPFESKKLVCVRYVDHVLYNRANAIAVKPQIRKAVGWLIYECDQYITVTWDHDDEPPTLQGGDSKASGLVLLKSEILELQRLPSDFELNLNVKPTLETEYALRPSERKTHRKQYGEATNDR